MNEGKAKRWNLGILKLGNSNKCRECCFNVSRFNHVSNYFITNTRSRRFPMMFAFDTLFLNLSDLQVPLTSNQLVVLFMWVLAPQNPCGVALNQKIEVVSHGLNIVGRWRIKWRITTKWLCNGTFGMPLMFWAKESGRPRTSGFRTDEWQWSRSQHRFLVNGLFSWRSPYMFHFLRVGSHSLRPWPTISLCFVSAGGASAIHGVHLHWPRAFDLLVRGKERGRNTVTTTESTDSETAM